MMSNFLMIITVESTVHFAVFYLISYISLVIISYLNFNTYPKISPCLFETLSLFCFFTTLKKEESEILPTAF